MKINQYNPTKPDLKFDAHLNQTLYWQTSPECDGLRGELERTLALETKEIPYTIGDIALRLANELFAAGKTEEARQATLLALKTMRVEMDLLIGNFSIRGYSNEIGPSVENVIIGFYETKGFDKRRDIPPREGRSKIILLGNGERKRIIFSTPGYEAVSIIGNDGELR